MSLNLVFPISSKNSGSKIKTNNLTINEKIKQQQAINLIPIYKNISAKTLKKKTLFEKSPENKIFNDSNMNNNSLTKTPLNQNNTEISFKEMSYKTNSNEVKNLCDEDSCSSKEKNLRIPLQSIKNNLARNKVFSAKINEKKTKNKFSINFEALKVENMINNHILGRNGIEDNNNNENNNLFKANLDKVRISKKSFGCVEGYAAMTTEGLVRGYNEDRVSIILNIPQPPTFKGDRWPKCSFFAIYDGHGGSACADFLRDNLHKFIISDSNFPENPQKAILNGFIFAEKVFMQEAMADKDNIERSGSCAIVVLIIEKRCYISNVGDSRAILSGYKGLKTYPLSRDHRPTEEKEYNRVLKSGGKIYQTEANFFKGQNTTENIVGPLRVMPGKLSVSRAFGDIEAKSPLFNGNPNVVIAKPDIKYFDINPNYDFIVIGCDGIFENMKNKELIEIIWKNAYKETLDIHNKCGVLVESVINECIHKKFSDNLTVVLISFKDELRPDFTDKLGLKTELVDKYKFNGEANSKNYNNVNTHFYTVNSEEKGSEEEEPTTLRVKDYSKLSNFVYNSNAHSGANNKKILQNIFKTASDNSDRVKQKFITLNDNNKNKNREEVISGSKRLILNKTQGDLNNFGNSNINASEINNSEVSNRRNGSSISKDL